MKIFWENMPLDPPRGSRLPREQQFPMPLNEWSPIRSAIITSEKQNWMSVEDEHLFFFGKRCLSNFRLSFRYSLSSATGAC